jgi:hypothetical protein
MYLMSSTKKGQGRKSREEQKAERITSTERNIRHLQQHSILSNQNLCWTLGKSTDDLLHESVPCDEEKRMNLWPTAPPKLFNKPVRHNPATDRPLRKRVLLRKPVLHYTKPVQADKTEPRAHEELEASSKGDIESFRPDHRIGLNWEQADYSFSLSPREITGALVPHANYWNQPDVRSDSPHTSIDRLRLLNAEKPSSITMKVHSSHAESSTSNKLNELQEFSEPTNHSQPPTSFTAYLQLATSRRQINSPTKLPTSILSSTKTNASSHRARRQTAKKENSSPKKVTFSSNNIVVVLME